MIRKSLEWFGGSVLVYVLVAACSGAASNGKLDMGSGGMLGMLTTSGDGDEPGDGDQPGTGDGDVTSDGTTTDATTNGDGDPTSGDGDGDMMTGIIDPVPDADAAEDGTRIVNLYRTTGDGLRTSEGYWDKQLQIQCGFTLAGDGKVRCLPSVPVASVAGYFADAACTQPVAVVTKGMCAAQINKSVKNEGNCSTFEMYRNERYALGEKLSVLYSGTPENCVDGTTTLLAAFDAYLIGNSIDPATYAEGTLIHD